MTITAPNEGVQAGTLRLRGVDVKTSTRDIDYKKLKFYVDNPRIYSIVRAEGHTPSQGEILKRLQTLEHVRELVQDIKANGGLIDPLIVRDGDFVVLEGNSRLAAYHYLASESPLIWSKVRCTLLPANIDEKLVFALLAQYHVKGKKDWAPYEKAGFVYRRHKHQSVDLTTVAAEIGLTKDEAKHLIGVYQFMIDHDDDDREHWSYYDELLKSRKIKQVRDNIASFDDFIVDEIKSGNITKAMDLRDRLPVICSANPKVVKRYMEGKYDFDEAYEAAASAGGENPALNKLSRFRKWLVAATTEDDMLEASKAIRDKMHYELKEVERKAKKLKELLDTKKTKLN